MTRRYWKFCWKEIMPIPPQLQQLQCDYDNSFNTIVFGVIVSFLGCISILLISFFEKKFKKQISKSYKAI